MPSNSFVYCPTYPYSIILIEVSERFTFFTKPRTIKIYLCYGHIILPNVLLVSTSLCFYSLPVLTPSYHKSEPLLKQCNSASDTSNSSRTTSARFDYKISFYRHIGFSQSPSDLAICLYRICADE